MRSSQTDDPGPPTRIPVTEVIKGARHYQDWCRLVRQFQQSVLHNWKPWEVTLTPTAKQSPEFLREEVAELEEAYNEGDIPKVIDGIVDLIYYAIGMADQMGVNLEPYFYEVHLANMEKVHDPDAVPGVNKRVIKPPGWQEPRILEIMKRVEQLS